MKNLSIKTIGWIILPALIALGVITIVLGAIDLSNVQTVGTTWDKFQAGRSEKARAVNALRRELGYGGLIHHFKNYVPRREIGPYPDRCEVS